MIYQLIRSSQRLTTVALTMLITVSITACHQSNQQFAANDNNSYVFSFSSIGNLGYQQSVDPRVEAMHYIILGEIAWNRNQLEDSLSYYLQALKIYPDLETASRTTELALVASQFEPALYAATQWATLDPTSQHAQAVVITLYTKSGQPDKALPFMDTLHKIDNDRFTQALILITSQMRTIQEREHLYELTKSFYQSHQKDVNAQFIYALAADRLDKHKEALKLVKSVIKKRPQWTQATALYVKLLQAKKDYKTAIKFLDKNLKAYPNNEQLRLLYAKLLVRTNQQEKAKQEYENLLANPLYRNDALIQLSVIAIGENRHDTASGYLLKLLEHDPANSAAYYYLGMISEKEGNPDQASKFYEKVGLSNYFYSAQTNLAILTARSGQLADALSRIHTLMLSFPAKQKELTLTSAHILLEANESENAMTLLTEALLDAPDDIDLLYTRGVVAAYRSDVKMTEKDLSRVLEKQPNHSNALNVLGYILADKTERYDEALGYLQRALKISPNNPVILDSMGWVLYRMERYSESVSHLKDAYHLDPDPEIAAHLGEVLYMSGQKKAAKKFLTQVYEQHKESPHLQQVMQRFNLMPH